MEKDYGKKTEITMEDKWKNYGNKWKQLWNTKEKTMETNGTNYGQKMEKQTMKKWKTYGETWKQL